LNLKPWPCCFNAELMWSGFPWNPKTALLVESRTKNTLSLPSGHQTWPTKIHHNLYMIFPLSPFIRDFPLPCLFTGGYISFCRVPRSSHSDIRLHFVEAWEFEI
jgi:hypothetical protein